MRTQDSTESSDSIALVRAGRLPDFLIIGAMKSGTTSLFELLGRHPDIFVPHWKEPQYFSRDHIFNQGEQWYKNLFVDARPDQRIGEASTCYSRCTEYPLAAERIAARLPDIRLIYLMRHPVERAYSHYGHEMQKRMMYQAGPVLTFEEALEEDREIINAGLYMMQIERYLSLFQREQMLFLTLDELKSTPASLLRKTFVFLGIPPIELTAGEKVKANQWGDGMAKKRIRECIEISHRIKWLSGAVKMIPQHARTAAKEYILQSNLVNYIVKRGIKDKKQSLTPMTMETRKQLLRRFDSPTRRLEEFLGYELADWHK